MKEQQNYYAVIMAGGVGSRFWPVSTSAYPKQFRDMMGIGESLLQKTYHRLAKLIKREQILILTNTSYLDLVKEQLPKITENQIVLEPVMKNTAPCILMAALKIQKENPNGIMIVAPSDHWIMDEDAFINDVRQAFNVAKRDDKLLTLGIKPTHPNTGYGYIKYDTEEEQNCKKVLKFTEKPTKKVAEKFLEEGNYLWNAGIFVWSVKFIIESFKTHQPEMYRLFHSGINDYNTTREKNFINENYSNTNSLSIDYGILENSEHVHVIPASFDWSDLGTWKSLHEQLAKDENENSVINAQLISENSEENIVYSEKGKVVIVDGLKDYIIVENDKVLIIVPKEKEQNIKEIRDLAMKKFGENYG